MQIHPVGWLAVLMLSLLIPVRAAAQEPEEPEVEVVIEEAQIDIALAQELNALGYFGGAKPKEEQKEELRATLEVVLDDLERVCQLDDKQAAKLRIAIKGAVEQHLRKPDAVEEVHLMGLAAEPVGEAPAGQAAPRENVVMRFSGTGLGQEPSVTEEAIWVGAVKSVLTEEQQRAYAQELKQRQDYRREALMKQLVAALDRALLLSAEQREQLSAVIGERLAGELIHQAELLRLFVGRFIHGEDPEVFTAIFLVPSAEAKEILTERQRKRWEQLRESEGAQRFGFQFGEGNLEIRKTDDGIVIVQTRD